MPCKVCTFTSLGSCEHKKINEFVGTSFDGEGQAEPKAGFNPDDTFECSFFESQNPETMPGRKVKVNYVITVPDGMYCMSCNGELHYICEFFDGSYGDAACDLGFHNTRSEDGNVHKSDNCLKLKIAEEIQ